jgi:hypothetical protein
VRRPGTFFICRAFTKHVFKPRVSRMQRVLRRVPRRRSSVGAGEPMGTLLKTPLC